MRKRSSEKDKLANNSPFLETTDSHVEQEWNCRDRNVCRTAKPATSVGRSILPILVEPIPRPFVGIDPNRQIVLCANEQ
jgi:hypothetical protein